MTLDKDETPEEKEVRETLDKAAIKIEPIEADLKRIQQDAPKPGLNPPGQSISFAQRFKIQSLNKQKDAITKEAKEQVGKVQENHSQQSRQMTSKQLDAWMSEPKVSLQGNIARGKNIDQSQDVMMDVKHERKPDEQKKFLKNEAALSAKPDQDKSGHLTPFSQSLNYSQIRDEQRDNPTKDPGKDNKDPDKE